LKRRTQFLLAASVIATLGTSIGACGGGNDNNKSTTAATTSTASTTGPTTVNASLGEYFIKLDSSVLPKGQVRFNVSNDGKIKHEFVVLRTNIAPGKLPLKKDGDANEEIAVSPGEIPGIASGKKKTLDVILKPGKYVLLCNLPGHYKYSQYTGVTVK
jgi:uncharacterized cupredoxin-like copper-binding protein